MAASRSIQLRRLYRFVAPIYAPTRPLWMGTIGRAAGAYLETEVLPKVLTPQSAILDLGCGPAINLTRLQRLGLPFAHYTGLDLSPHMLSARRTTAASFVQGNADQLPFAAHSFDLVISTWLFSHLPEPLGVVRKAMRLLQPGGYLVVVCFSRSNRLLWRWLRPFEKLFLMKCILPEEIHAWPGDVCVRFFAGGYNAVVTLSYK